MQSTENVKKWKFDLYLFSQSLFRFHNIYLVCEICDKNVSNEKHEELRNYLFKMKNWIKLYLEKGSSLQLKGTFAWQKSTWIFKKGRWR